MNFVSDFFVRRLLRQLIGGVEFVVK
jgi:hypothetical protein